MLPTGAWVEKHPCLGHPALGPRGGMKRENLQVTVKLLLKMACPTSAHVAGRQRHRPSGGGWAREAEPCPEEKQHL